MKQFRRIILWAVLVGIALLIIFSIVETRPNKQDESSAARAKDVFNSIPLVVYWIVLGVVLIAGIVLFKRLRRSPGLLAVHLGSLLILLGAMFGSERGHVLAGNLFGTKKVPSGTMVIYEGQTSNSLLGGDPEREIGKLPFSVKLKDFWIDYYHLEDQRWLLVAVDAPRPAGGEAAQKAEPAQEIIKWTVGSEAIIPYTQARLKVLQYLDSARAKYDPKAKNILEVTQADGKKIVVPAESKRWVSLENPKAELRIVQVFSNLIVRGTGEKRQVIDSPGPTQNPALKVEIKRPDGSREERYIMVRLPRHGQGQDGLKLHYLIDLGAEPDPHSALPAMEILLSYKGKEQKQWLIAEKGSTFVRLSLGELLGPAESESEHCQEHTNGTPSLYLAKPQKQIRDYKSDLLVLKDGREVAAKVIEVNDPLHYGGYHFYQSAYDAQREQYTVLSVTSDSGLAAVYVGFILLVVGVFWLFWGRPILVYLSRRRDDGT